MTSILDAYDQCWMQLGTEVLHSDWEGALNDNAAKAILKAKGTEQRVCARGQFATTVEPRSGYYDTYFTSWRLNSTALFAAGAFTFYNEVSPFNALFGRQPAMHPGLPVLDHEQQTETSDHT
eukprot:2155214-Pyramimonas_sp.AAC.1